MEAMLDKIRKLLRLATSNNVHEAALAAMRAQELIEKHAIEMEMLREPKSKGYVPEPDEFAQMIIWTSTSTRIPTWIISLGSYVTEVLRIKWSMCSGYAGFDWEKRCPIKNYGSFTGYGPQASLKAAEVMLEHLITEINRLLKLDPCVSGRRGNNSFRLGAVSEIGKRLREGQKRALAEKKREAVYLAAREDPQLMLALDSGKMKIEEVSCTTLVHVDRALERLQGQQSRIKDWQSDEGIKLGKARSRNSRVDWYAHGRGQQAGKRAKLS